MSQPPWNCAVGLPQVDGFGDPAVISPGMDPRAKNQIEIAVSVHSVA